MPKRNILERLQCMTLDEKLSLMHGQLYDVYGANQAGHVPGIERLGIPAIFIADGEYGVNVTWEATALPAKVSLAATFDAGAALSYGRALGAEARAVGMHIILSTRVNIVRDPVAQIGQSNGGNFQALSEDPLLNGILGVAEVRGIEENHNAIANLKQVFGSSTGTSQGAENSVIDEQTIHEVYLKPFEMVIKAGVGSLMTSYNQVNGIWTYRHTEALDTLARGEWGFDGIIVNDWCCLYDPKAVKGGVTLEMPEPFAYGERLREQVLDPSSGIAEADIDRCVYAYLHTLDRFGMLEQPRVPGPIDEATKLRHIPVARKLASRGAVLLKNNGILPLDAQRQSIGVIGSTGRACAMPVFKESAYGFSDRKQSPLAALRELSSRDIPFEEGNDLQGEPIPAQCFQNLVYYQTRYESDPMADRDLDRLPPPEAGNVSEIPQVYFQADNALPALHSPDAYYLFCGDLLPEETGWHRICLQSKLPGGEEHSRNHITNRDMFCFTSGNLYLRSDDDTKYRCIGIGTRTAMNGGIVPNSDVVPCTDGWNNAAGFVYLEAGKTYKIAATAMNLYHDPLEVRLSWSKPSRRKAHIASAAALAAKVEVPVVFVWHKSPSESILLQEEQNELVDAVSAANPNTVIVLNNGDPIAMPWIDRVAAVLDMWFPGQEGGYATADVLLGREDPGGRLPVTFPKRLEDTAPHAPGRPERCAPCGKVADDAHGAEEAHTAFLTEGVCVGYRWLDKEGIRPLFPFGHGLSYSKYQLDLISAAKTKDGGASAVCRVRNVGQRKGVCVLQGYLDRPAKVPPNVQVAEKALAAFASVELMAGDCREVELSIPPESFQYWRTGETEGGWTFFEGPRKLRIGTSSENLILSADV